MKKKLFITAILLAIFTFAFLPNAFANTGMDNAVNGIRNFVGGTENVMEDAGKGVVNGVKDGVNAVGNGARDVANGIDNGMNRDNRANDMTPNNGGYTATRTSTDTGATGLFGNVSNDIWTWMVLAIVGIVIVALVMYYAKQNNITTYHHDDNDDE